VLLLLAAVLPFPLSPARRLDDVLLPRRPLKLILLPVCVALIDKELTRRREEFIRKGNELEARYEAVERHLDQALYSSHLPQVSRAIKDELQQVREEHAQWKAPAEKCEAATAAERDD